MELKLKTAISVAELAKKIDAEPRGSVSALEQTMITNLAALDKATPGCVSFLANPLYKKHLPNTQASAVLLSAADAADYNGISLISKNPRLSLAKILHLCATPKAIFAGIHSSAVIDPSATLGANIIIAPHCVIGANTQLGDNVVLEAGVVIGADCTIGADTVLKANVTIYDGVQLGSNCLIHSGTVIGSDGFGFAQDQAAGWVKMPHLGAVIIGNQVEIGSNTSIDRGMLDNTVIGDQVIIDNQVQIGHNVIIGARTAIAGCVGIAGSATIGKNCMIGGAACINGHLEIGDNVIITGMSGVNHSISQPGIYSSGIPARENSEWRKNVARFMMLDSMAKRIRELEKNMEKIDE